MLRRIALCLAAVIGALLLAARPAEAHPMPHSVVLLDVRPHSVSAELRLPVDDFTLASGLDPSTASDAALKAYLVKHVRPRTTDGHPWQVQVGTLEVTKAEQTASGPYRELVAEAVLTPPAGADVRHFTLGYDVIVHQVVTHVTLVSVRRDWAAGSVDGGSAQVGTIQIDPRSMTIAPLDVDLKDGSAWRGFAAMVKLGGEHILTGTDHLLFLFTLLLGIGASLRRIGLVTLAFTAGHSAALVIAALSRVEFPSRPVEAFIAASILVSAVHAIRPIFPGREPLVAGLFGLGHGMAFSFTLAELRLPTGQLALSLFGFNLGIELIQLFLVALALPTLLLLTRLKAHAYSRTLGAALAAVAALGWLADRLGWPNPVARFADAAGAHTSALVAVLGVAAAGSALRAVHTRRQVGVEERQPCPAATSEPRSSSPVGA